MKSVWLLESSRLIILTFHSYRSGGNEFKLICICKIRLRIRRGGLLIEFMLIEYKYEHKENTISRLRVCGVLYIYFICSQLNTARVLEKKAAEPQVSMKNCELSVKFIKCIFYGGVVG